MNDIMLISDAAKEVNVENHVLRYWEEELHLPIKRNELGHRYYTQEDVERFKQIKSMKERGLQLKAIKMILKNGKLDVLSQQKEEDKKGDRDEVPVHENPVEESVSGMAIDIVESHEYKHEITPEDKEDKARRLQWLLQQLIRETLQENNQQLCRDIKESVVKELDYQFRIQEEREEERDRRQIQRSEDYYKKMDELLRKKSRRILREAVLQETDAGMNKDSKKEAKKKRHSVF
uniref:helix-turn-helix domain-containing protein n=1 Tax=Acetatifactor sp. TaxID=1872090 RepID=UPI0040570EA0